MPRRLTRALVGMLDAVGRVTGRKAPGPAHLARGRTGEDQAYFYLRKRGYVIVARNFRSPRCKGEIDMVGWDGDVLCFIEVKTRSSADVAPAEAAVDEDKRQNLRLTAREYLRQLRSAPACRFDVLSVYCDNKSTPQITLFRDAFS